MQQFDSLTLISLFLIGFFGHTFGFVLNDIIDYRIDKTSEELSDRPLISGTISIKKAWIFAIFSMFISFFIAIYVSFNTNNFYPLFILVISAFFILIYDLIGKKYPFMDIFVALGIGYAGVLSLFFLPAVLSRIKLPSTPPPTSTSRSRWQRCFAIRKMSSD